MILAMFWPTVAVKELAARTVVVYLAVLLLLRLGGKRQIGQMGAGEFVAILLISNAVQNAMSGGDNSLGGGLFVAAILIALSCAASYLCYKSRRAESLLQGRPTLLIHEGQLIDRNLQREQLNHRELRTILRRQGVHDFREVHEAVLESDGSVSLIKKSELAAPAKP